MRIKFWGVRGSYPTPLSPQTLREKISTVVQRIKPSDLESPDAREKFLATLPEWLYGTPGGNTPCIEVRLADGTCIVFDAGSGMVPLSRSLFAEPNPPGTFHVFFSHFHYDHIQGFPFFGQAYHPARHFHFYSPEEDLEYILRDQMQHPYFPVTMEGKMTKHLFFHGLRNQNITKLGTAEITWLELRHPGRAYAYKVVEGAKTFIYATDVELMEADFDKSKPMYDFFKDADMVIMDTMYTLGEAIEKYNWGHSSFSLAVEFAIMCGVKQFFLFHHEPNYSDKQLYTNLRTAKLYAERHKSPIEIRLAEEGTTVILGAEEAQ